MPERRKKIGMMIRPSLQHALQVWADRRGIGYQTLIQELLTRAVQDDLPWAVRIDLTDEELRELGMEPGPPHQEVANAGA